MIENITGAVISRDRTSKIRSHLGTASADMYDYTKLELRDHPNIFILNCGANDITNEINILKKVKSG